MTLKILGKSKKVTIKNNASVFKINFFTQFFIPIEKTRLAELQSVLKRNVDNKNIDIIYLLNEKIYSDIELGCTSEKIVQININKRLRFSDFFTYIKVNKILGFNILANSDIFFDDSIRNLNMSDIDISKKMFALLRYEYLGQKDLSDCYLYGSTKYYEKSIESGAKIPEIEGNPASNDTWIIHSNNNLTDKEIKLFNFELGKQGCDNKIIYLFKLLGYDIYNDVEFIRTYHHHMGFSGNRDYSNKDMEMPPWGILFPSCVNLSKVNLSILKVNLTSTLKDNQNLSFHHFTNDNLKLKMYIEGKMLSGSNFIIPRIAGIENVIAYLGVGLFRKEVKWDYLKYRVGLKIMKKNAGIKLTNDESIIKYSKCYCSAFEMCDLFASWEIYGDVRKAIQKSHDFVRLIAPQNEIWGYVYDIFHYIDNPWTHALEGKRILIISPFVESIKEKLDIRANIYGKDLFPNCQFILLKPPQTQGDEDCEEFYVEFNKFCSEVLKVKDEFDVALCSCGGYGNPICAFIYNLGKSAIYVGGVLQMYFGIYGERWLKERKDVIRLYLNEHWSRPKISEKPKAANEIEEGCYW